MKNKAILNEENILIGFKEVEELQEGDVDGGDADLNISRGYKWTGETFRALGTGYPKPKPHDNGVTMEYAIYLMMKALVDGNDIPSECGQWVTWFEKNLKKRQNEKLIARRRF